MVACLVLAISCTQNTFKLKDIQINESLSRTELVKLPLSEQQRIISELSPNKKYELWRAKMDYLISSSELEEAELYLLTNLRQQMSVDFFSGEDATCQNTLDATINDLKMKHAWSEEKIFVHFMTIMTEEEFKSNTLIHHKQ